MDFRNHSAQTSGRGVAGARQWSGRERALILVIGGRSKIGSALIEELLSRGERVRALVRAGERAGRLPAAAVLGGHQHLLVLLAGNLTPRGQQHPDQLVIRPRLRRDAGFGPPFDHLALVVRPADGSGPWLADVGFGSHSVYPLRFDSRAEQDDPAARFRLADTPDADVDVHKNGQPQYRIEPRARALR